MRDLQGMVVDLMAGDVAENSSVPFFVRFVVRELATSHWFDLTAARRDFGYAPQVSTVEGLERLRLWLWEKKER